MTSGMPGMPHALLQAVSLPGTTTVSGRGRPNAFARLLDTGTMADVSDDPTEVRPSAADAVHRTRAPASRSASSLKPDTPVTQSEASQKEGTSEQSRSRPAKRTARPSTTDQSRTQIDQPSATIAGQSDPPATASIPVAEPGPPSASPTTPSNTATETTAPAQPVPAHRSSAGHAEELRPSPDGAHAGPYGQSPAMQQPQASSSAPSPTPIATAAQPLPAAALAVHNPSPAPRIEASRISAPSPTPSATPAAAALATSPAPSTVAISAHVANPQHLTIQLTPPELGKLEVHIDRPADAPARVEIKVEHARTLDLLSQDQPKLQQALDQAGVPAHRQVVLTLSEGSKGFDGSNADRRSTSASQGEPNLSGAEVAESEPPDAPRWVRSALDITA